MSRLAGKIAVITGGSTGMGLATAQTLRGGRRLRLHRRTPAEGTGCRRQGKYRQQRHRGSRATFPSWLISTGFMRLLGKREKGGLDIVFANARASANGWL